MGGEQTEGRRHARKDTEGTLPASDPRHRPRAGARRRPPAPPPQLGADPPATAPHRRGPRQVRPMRGRARVEAGEDPAVRFRREDVAQRKLGGVDEGDGQARAAGRGHAQAARVRAGTPNPEREGASVRRRGVGAEGATRETEDGESRVDRGSRGRRALSRRGDVRAASTDGRHGHVRPARRASRGGGGRGGVDAREEREGEVGARGL